MTDSPRLDPGRTAVPRPRFGVGRGAARMVAALLMVQSFVGGCRNGSDKGATPREAPASAVDLRIGSRTFHLSIAATEDTRNLGLMGVTSMPEDRGMVFVFRDDKPLSFYMKNTLIPLDIIYVNSAGNVVSIHRMEPQALDARGAYLTTPSGAPAKYAIELNAGAAGAAGVKVGDHLEFPPQVKDPPDLE